MTAKSKLFILPVAIILLYSCSNSETKRSAESTPKNTISTMKLYRKQIEGKIHLPGIIQPFEYVQLYPRINGFVKKVLVDRGSIVKEGQVLLLLEAPEIEQQVAAAKLKYAQANSTYLTSIDRYKRLVETSKTPGTVSAFDLSSAADKMSGDSATVQGEYANYKAQQSMKDYLTLKAPFDGIITERNVHPGALVGPGTQNAKPMLVLQQLSKLRLVIDIPEQYANQVKTGDTVKFRIKELPGEEYNGTVARSSQSLNSNFHSETVEIDIPNTANIFKPGMYAEASLPISGNIKAFIVPNSAIITTTERKYVVVVDNEIAKWCDITEGNHNKDSTEVFGKFNEGDEVIINGSYRLKDGTAVNK